MNTYTKEDTILPNLSILSTNTISTNTISTNEECKTLVIGGGGSLIYSFVGVLNQMFTNKDLSQIVNCIGTSAGAIIAMIITSGATNEYITQMMCAYDIKTISDHSSWTVYNIYSILKYFGYNKGEVALQWLENIVETLTGNRNITFAQHYALFKKNLIITGCNISKNTFRYFNRLTDPDMKISHAIRISMSVPLFFKPFEYNGDLYIDGGTTLNYPISFVVTDMFKLLNNYDPEIIGPNYTGEIMNVTKAQTNLYDLDLDIMMNDTTSKDFILKRTIGIKTFNKRTLNYIKPGSNYGVHADFNIYSYCMAVMSMMTDAALREYIDEEMWSRTIKIDSSKYDSLNFNVTTDMINSMIELGRNSTIHFMGGDNANINTKKIVVPTKRKSKSLKN